MGCGLGEWNGLGRLVGVGCVTHCWVLKDQAVWFGCSVPASMLVRLVGVWVWLLGLLFEICIVDASIFCSVCCFDVVETSYKGHMVDALASRADEGRRSLR